jgi:hypothetical protein
VIDDLYRRSAAAGDWNSRRQALRKALTMRDRAWAAGKGREAAVFGRWLEERLGEAEAAGGASSDAAPTGKAGGP